jgi:hypothetical protein
VVFCKQKNGRIVMRSLPLKKKKRRKYTEIQQAQMDLFKDVREKRRLIKRDPVELAKYVARCPSDRYINNFITSEVYKELKATGT